jgi:hypothetical protein
VHELEAALARDLDPTAPFVARFEVTWARILEVATANRQLWAANFEVSPYIDTIPEVKAVMAAAQEKAREGLAELFISSLRPADPAADRSVGAFHYALMTGVIAQWLIDPEKAPTAKDLTEALKLIAADVVAG